MPPAATPVKPPDITWENKLGWIIRLEDQRLLRDPNPEPPAILVPATKNRPAIVAPAAPSDLVRLLSDPEARTRRRAALALGRVGLPAAIEPLTLLLTDEEFEVRQMAAFALGLIGDAAARPALLTALMDPHPVVQGRAAEALGLIGSQVDAVPVSAMVQAQVRSGALTGVAADDLSYPLAPAAEAARLGLYALVRLGSYDALAAAALDGEGRPVSPWWPVAYALQRAGNAKATPALLTLLHTPGRHTAAFAARGLGAVKAREAVEPLMQMISARQVPTAVLVQSLRALTAISDGRAGPAMLALASDATQDPVLRIEALQGVGALRPPDAIDPLLDLISEASPVIRAAALRALARVDAETFLSALAGIDADRDWTVRVEQANALAGLPAAQAAPRLTAMLGDPDQRVIPAVVNALVTAKAPGLEPLLLEHLKAEDPVIRAAAAAGLGALAATAAVPPLAAAYKAWQGDVLYTARAAALAALVTLDRAAARPVLQDALQDRDWAVRVRAAELLRESGVTESLGEAIRPAPQGRTIADSEWNWLLAPPYSPHAFLDTGKGLIELELAVLDAPLTVANFIDLARKGFFNNVPIHRVVADFVVQDGDPRGDGEGGPGYTIRDELNQRPYLRGTLGMALDWKDTGGSQFFLTHSPQPHLDAKYTVFGHVVSGMEVVDAIQPWDVLRSVTIRDGVR